MPLLAQSVPEGGGLRARNRFSAQSLARRTYRGPGARQAQLKHAVAPCAPRNRVRLSRPGIERFDRGGLHREHQPKVNGAERATNYEEIELAMPESQAVREAERCLRCYRVGMLAVN